MDGTHGTGQSREFSSETMFLQTQLRHEGWGPDPTICICSLLLGSTFPRATVHPQGEGDRAFLGTGHRVVVTKAAFALLQRFEGVAFFGEGDHRDPRLLLPIPEHIPLRIPSIQIQAFHPDPERLDLLEHAGKHAQQALLRTHKGAAGRDSLVLFDEINTGIAEELDGPLLLLPLKQSQ